MDDDRRDDGNVRVPDDGSVEQNSVKKSDSSHDHEMNGVSGIENEQFHESERAETTLMESLGTEEEQPYLRLVTSETLKTSKTQREIEKRRKKRQKKIQRRMKRKEMRKRFRKILLIILLIGILIGIASWLFFSSTIFAVSEITVNHNTLKSDKYLIYESGIKVGENIFQFKSSEVKKSILDENPYISDVSISRKLPNRVIITVKEHAPAVAIKYDGEYLILDKTGRVAGTEKTQLTATRLTGVEVKHYTPGKVPVVQNSSILKESLNLINKVNASGLYFKKLDVSSSMIVHGYLTDDLECMGEAEDIIENLEGIKAIIYDLNQKKTMKGTIYVGDDGYATFSPASTGSSSTGKTSESTEKSVKKDNPSKTTEEKNDQEIIEKGKTNVAG